jgi:hypothetical protein
MIVSMKTEQATGKATQSEMFTSKETNHFLPKHHELECVNTESHEQTVQIQYTSQLFTNAVSSKKVKKTSKPTHITAVLLLQK